MEYQRATRSAQKEQSSPPRSSFSQTSLNRIEAHQFLALQRTIGNQAVSNMPGPRNEQIDTPTRALTGSRPGHDFSQIPMHPPKAEVRQAKLAIAEPGDEYEQEADHVSAHVMRMPAPSVALRDPVRNAVPPATGEVSHAPGQPLDTATRAFMESRFGRDFSRVRVHTGGDAAASARAVGARAYTYGSDVFFGAGQYSPGTYEGRGLLAHELAHVVQQRAPAPQNPALPGSEAAAEAKAGRAAGQADAAVVRERRVSAIQLQPRKDAGPTQPAPIKARTEITDRIEDAYGSGSLDKEQWQDLQRRAKQAYDNGDRTAAESDYLALYRDVAQLAQAGLAVTWRGWLPAINIVHGGKTKCNDAKPGLNFSLDSGTWGANATTDFVDEQGNFGAKLRPPGSVQPQVAIVLSRSAFTPDKEEALGTLRHEMIHAEHHAKDASALQSARQGKPDPVPTRNVNSEEVLGYVEGFMTMFHLRHPAPSDANDPAFVELLGALETTKLLPWAYAEPSVKSEALGQLQEYYCHALDPDHRKAFEGWVSDRLRETRKNRTIADSSKKDKPSPAQLSKPPASVSTPGSAGEKAAEEAEEKLRQASREDFFNGLQNIINRKCKGLTTARPL
jgi:Domain of unknown function (DUF4157)